MECISKKVYPPTELIDDFSVRNASVKDHTWSPLFVEYFASIASVLLFQSIRDASRTSPAIYFSSLLCDDGTIAVKLVN